VHEHPLEDCENDLEKQEPCEHGPPHPEREHHTLLFTSGKHTSSQSLYILHFQDHLPLDTMLIDDLPKAKAPGAAKAAGGKGKGKGKGES
jgi:hypothetical protein